MHRFASAIVFAALIVCAFAFPRHARAATRYVGPGETFTTIQSAIDASLNGDMIIVRDGTYTGPGNREVILDKTVWLHSQNGPTPRPPAAAKPRPASPSV